MTKETTHPTTAFDEGLAEMVSDHERQQSAIVDETRLVGELIGIDYNTADILVHDKAKQAVGGVQQGCILVAVRLGLDEQADPTSPYLLLRPLKSVPLPNDAPVQQARFEGAQRVAESNRNWDDKEVTDIFTLTLMRYTGIRCRILGTYRPHLHATGDKPFHSDLDNFYSGQALKIYKPTGAVLERILNDTRRSEGPHAGTKIGHIRYAASSQADGAAVYIAPDDFVAKRTALFGMTRTGKSNTVKTIARAVFEMRQPEIDIRVGQLIFDPNGEYANANPQDQGCVRNLSNISCAREGDVVTYGLHEHPHDPDRHITKFNFFGISEPWQHPGDRPAAKSLSSLFHGKSILNDQLANETSGYTRPFMGQDMAPPQAHEGQGAWVRYRRSLLIYRGILVEAGFPPPSFAPSAKSLFNKKLRGLMEEDADLQPLVEKLESGLRWAEVGRFARAFAKFVGTEQFRRFNIEEAEASDDGREWSDSRFTDLLKFFDNTRGLNLLKGAVNSTGGRDGSAMMAGCKSQRPTGGGVQYGTACLFRGARLD